MTIDLATDHSAEWMHHGFCADSGFPDRWFPSEGRPESAGLAEALCGGCPVRVQCLRYAIADPTLDGIWGGVTTSQRKEIRRWANASHGTYGGYLRHRKFDETPCAECRAANAEQSRKKRERSKRDAA